MTEWEALTKTALGLGAMALTGWVSYLIVTGGGCL